MPESFSGDTFPTFVDRLTRRIDEVERRIIALALATGHPELATPFPDPGYQAYQDVKAGKGLSRAFDTTEEFIADLHRVARRKSVGRSKRKK